MIEYKRPYELSNDYDLLKRLLDEGNEIVCFADYTWLPKNSVTKVMRDVCIAKKTSENEYKAYCRGIVYTETYPWLDAPFDEYMQAVNLRFIPPTRIWKGNTNAHIVEEVL